MRDVTGFVRFRDSQFNEFKGTEEYRKHYLKWIEPHPTVSHHPLLSHQDIGISRKSTHNRCVRSCTGIRNADIYEHEALDFDLPRRCLSHQFESTRCRISAALWACRKGFRGFVNMGSLLPNRRAVKSIGRDGLFKLIVSDGVAHRTS
jgi:hypothetical protein